ncbi:AAA family ATPase [Streptomyces sp. S1A(2023)]
MSSGVRTQVAVTPQANEDIRRLDAATKNAVGDFVRRLRADRSNRALRLTFLREAGGNGRLFLAALDGSRMGLLLETEENRFSLLAIRVGPAARDGLARLTVEINSVSGGVELVDQSEVSANVVAMPDRPVLGPEPGTSPEESPVADTTATRTTPPADVQATPAATPAATPTPVALPVPLFARYGDEELIELGVIASLLPALRRITDSHQLTAVLGHNLPGLTREVLLALHDGMEPREVRTFVTDQWRAEEKVDPQDWARAARRPISQVSTEDAAVLDALGDSFDAWRLFLHPEQYRLATTSFKGSAKVTGGPGTGKTVVALHRVRHLVARLASGQTRPVLLTTYNTNLAADLRERLYQLGGDALARRVDVKSVDQLAREVVEQHPGIRARYAHGRRGGHGALAPGVRGGRCFRLRRRLPRLGVQARHPCAGLRNRTALPPCRTTGPGRAATGGSEAGVGAGGDVPHSAGRTTPAHHVRADRRRGSPNRGAPYGQGRRAGAVQGGARRPRPRPS